MPPSLSTVKSLLGLLMLRSRDATTRWWGTRPRAGIRQPRTFTELMRLSKESPRDAYAAALYTLRYHAPDRVRSHRSFFSHSGRGFGEDAFHGTWWLLFQERTPELALEIGVFRGQAISLWALLAQGMSTSCDVHGISPLEAVGDSVSIYPEDIDYEADIRASFVRFDLPQPTLVRALSTEAEAVQHIESHEWDLVYVDGSHDYEVAKQDVVRAWSALRPGGTLVADDAALFLDVTPFKGAYMGHEGPSRAIREFADEGHAVEGTIGHLVFLRKEGP